MKLIIQIPCLNEEDQLEETIARLPRAIPGIDTIEYMIIDDGSTDRTVDVAKACGVQHIVRLPTHKGLSIAFQTGIDACVKLGADIIVNTDADGQYGGHQIADLVKPILAGTADLVVGDRGVGNVAEFSWLKRRLQSFGSRVVQGVAGAKIPDATSGFRAYTRDTALQLTLVTSYTYTLESLIQAGNSALSIQYIPIERFDVERPSRLFKSKRHYVRKSIGTILQMYVFYKPLRLFALTAVLLAIGAIAAWMPFALSWIRGDGSSGHIQSVVLGAVLFMASVQVFGLGLIADLLGRQRILSMRTLERVRRSELHMGVPPMHYEANLVHPPAAVDLADTPVPTGEAGATRS
jgi:glycosyltransferase involved in cell wall biosynthesis